jgi:hypothetical protein
MHSRIIVTISASDPPHLCCLQKLILINNDLPANDIQVDCSWEIKNSAFTSGSTAKKFYIMSLMTSGNAILDDVPRPFHRLSWQDRSWHRCTGEAMNEVPLGFNWPSASVRLARTTEAIQIINKLWEEGKRGNDDDGFVNFSGQYFKIKNAKLYTSHSSEKISLYMAAVGEEATKLLLSILMVDYSVKA